RIAATNTKLPSTDSWPAQVEEETGLAQSEDRPVYVNKVGTFGLSPASYWWTRIAACGIRLVKGYRLELLLYADDLEVLGLDARGWLPRGVAGMETDYVGYKLGLSKKRADWLVGWLREKVAAGKVSAKEMSQGLGRLGFAATALDWERPFLGPLHAWSAAIQGKPGLLTLPTMLRILMEWLAGKLGGGERLQAPESMSYDSNVLSFFTDAKAWAPWAFAKKDPNKVIAALELLATLVKLWVPCSEERKSSREAIRGYTDNKSNEAVLRKLMTTKFPSILVLMELDRGKMAAKRTGAPATVAQKGPNQLAEHTTT
ncbi:unnamed protein product, partial [Symbiodinium natans]